jgi:Flp pilus assembly CpaE family ATPase
LAVLRQLEYPMRKVRFVLGRVHKAQLNLAEVERALGHPVLARIGEDRRTARLAQVAGESAAEVAPKSALALDIEHVGARLFPNDVIVPAGFWRRMFSRKAPRAAR